MSEQIQSNVLQDKTEKLNQNKNLSINNISSSLQQDQLNIEMKKKILSSFFLFEIFTKYIDLETKHEFVQRKIGETSQNIKDTNKTLSHDISIKSQPIQDLKIDFSWSGIGDVSKGITKSYFPYGSGNLAIEKKLIGFLGGIYINQNNICPEVDKKLLIPFRFNITEKKETKIAHRFSGAYLFREILNINFGKFFIGGFLGQLTHKGYCWENLGSQPILSLLGGCSMTHADLSIQLFGYKASDLQSYIKGFQAGLTVLKSINFSISVSNLAKLKENEQIVGDFSIPCIALTKFFIQNIFINLLKKIGDFVPSLTIKSTRKEFIFHLNLELKIFGLKIKLTIENVFTKQRSFTLLLSLGKNWSKVLESLVRETVDEELKAMVEDQSLLQTSTNKEKEIVL